MREEVARVMHAGLQEGLRELHPDAHDSSFESWDSLSPASRSAWLVAADVFLDSFEVTKAT